MLTRRTSMAGPVLQKVQFKDQFVWIGILFKNQMAFKSVSSLFLVEIL